MKIAYYCLRPFDELLFAEKYGKEYGVDFIWTSEYPNDSNIEFAQGCDAVSLTPCLITEDYIDRFAKCGVKHFLCRSIGYEHLPREYMKKYGMTASTSPYPTECVANYAIMLILMCTRKISLTMKMAAAQDYTLKGKMGKEIGSLTVGVIGTGSIGSTVIRHLSGFGCRILCYSRHENEEVKKYAQYVDLDTLYAESDVITLHLAANSSTMGILNDDAFSKMKDGVVIVNTARGTLIDTDALIRALKSGKVADAALDVFDNEKNLYYAKRTGDVIDNDNFNLLQAYPNVIMTPHTSFYTETTVSEMLKKNSYSAHCYAVGEEDPYRIF